MVIQDRLKRLPWFEVAIIALSVLLYASFSFGLPERYNSPDEAANTFFAGRISDSLTLAVPEPLNSAAGEPIVHPRSTVVIQDRIVPASFPGFALFVGTVARVLGPETLPYITPILGAILGLSAVYLLVRELSGRQAARWVVILTALQPAFWYYHSRSFFHNALFLDFFLVAAYLAVHAVRSKWSIHYLLLGISVGAALAMRTSEVFWITVAGFAFLFMQRKQVVWRYVWLTLVGVFVTFAPILATNQGMYGSPLSIGYRTDLNLITSNFTEATTLLGQLVLPFGFHPRIMAENAMNYLMTIQWWWFVAVGLGIVHLLATWKKLSPMEKKFAPVLLIIGFWLAVVYGSWSFHDNPDSTAITLGTSYARYWLPLYVLLLWPVGRALVWFIEKKSWSRYPALFFVGVYGVLSMNLVLFEPLEGLVQIRQNLMRFNDWSQEVQNITEPSSVIVSGMTDKLFWPQRAVVYDLVNPGDFKAIGSLLTAGYPVYRFHPTWEPDDLTLVNHRLVQYGLELVSSKTGFQDFSLYRFQTPRP